MIFSPRKNDFRGNFLFQIFFLWLETLFFKGFRRKITQKDLFPCPREQNSQFIFKEFDKHWQTELGKSTPDIKVALAKTLKAPFLTAGLFHFLEAFFLLVQAILVTEFSSLCVPSNNTSNSTISGIGLSLSLALCISLISLFLTINHSIAFDILYCVGMQMRTICITAIFKKVLRMQQSVLRSTSAGHIINLASNDVYKFDLGVLFWNFFWISPLIALMCTAILLVYIGPIGLIGVLYILLHTPLQVSLGILFGHFRHLQSLTADKRILLMDQIIRGIRVIKFYVWESSFIRLISKIRRREVYFASLSGILQSTTFSFFNSSLFIALFLVYAASVATEDPLSPSKVGLVFLVLNTLRIDMVLVLGHAIFSGKESVIALRRIQQLLELPEDVQASFARSASSPGEPSSIRFSKLSASWRGAGDPLADCMVLKSINLELIGPLLVVVTGPVSSGKSSLLLSILNELPGVSGHLTIAGVPSYAAQEPWIFSGTIRDNIIFGNPLNAKRYWRIINACSLKADIDSFDGGDLTLIGERGVTLSGGQKARVSLARSVYHQADIYLFDDPLSAVDSQVGRELFRCCMRRFLSGKLILLVTHQICYVRQADHIVLMRDGAVVGSGSYEEVIRSSEFCRDYLRGLDTVHQTKSDSKYITHSQSSYASNSDEEISVQDESRQSLIPTSAGDGEYTMPLSASLSVEQSQRHSHSLVTYLQYFWAGGFPTTLLLLALTILSNGCLLLAYWWMQSIAKCSQILILHPTNNTASYACSWYFNFRHLPSLGLLGFLTLSGSLFMFLRGFNFYYLALQAARRLHNRMLSSVMRTKIYFYDTNPSGRILNRFSKDIGFLDEQLPIIFYDFWQSSTYNIAIAIACCAIQNILIIPFLFLCITTLSLRYWYLRTSTQVKRLESVSRSPLYSHISLTLQGLSTIRALGMQRRLTQDFYYFQDEHTRAWYHYTACQKWFGLRLDVLTALLAIFGIISAFVGKCVLGWDELTDFSIPLLLTLPSTFQYVVRLSGEVEILMVSVDRILNYVDLPREQIASGPTAYPVPNDNVGHIEYKNIFFSYADDLPYSLVDVSFSVYPGEKVGVIGRTGAGKSSLFNSLFLTNGISAGRIYVDDVDISTLSVSEHRRRLSIIPQDPFLFSGTLRQNLDPLGEFSNGEIWVALDKSHLKRKVQSLAKQLLSPVAEHGYNFSTGERQLLCLARAMLRRNKIILVDEATANVDLQTDSLVQQALRTHFSDCSMITIAHRIETILDSDRIVVLEHGRVVETEIPFLMLQDSNSYLSTLLSQLDTSTQSNLRSLALQNYNRFLNSSTAIGGGQCTN